MQKSIIAQAIEGDSMFVFKPTEDFYEAVQINKKRWGLIYRGKQEPLLSEVKRLSEYLKIPIDGFIRVDEFLKAENQSATS